jgi:hypothetical protein
LKNDYVKINEIDSNNDTLLQSSSYSQRTLSLGLPTSLLIGKAENVEASTLIKFSIIIQDSIRTQLLSNSLNVVSAKISLEQSYQFGDTNSSLDFTVHKVLSKWAQHFSADSLASFSFEPGDISSNKTFSDTLNEFNISNDVVLSWLNLAADSAANDGIYIQPAQGANKVVGFESLYYGSVTPPTLTIVLEKPGVYIDTLSFLPALNINTVTGNVPALTGSKIIVQSGLVIHGRLSFDISKIPPHSVINDAEVTLTLDPASSSFGTDSANTILAAYLTDSTRFVVDSTYSIANFAKTNNAYKGIITSFVQRWLNTKNNQGILLFTSNQANSVDRFTFYGSGVADTTLKPRLNVIYTVRK